MKNNKMTKRELNSKLSKIELLETQIEISRKVHSVNPSAHHEKTIARLEAERTALWDECSFALNGDL